MNCRGKETRIKIVREYTLEPTAHLQLLDGQQKTSCTGDRLTDSYYVFSYMRGEERGTIQCGSHAAKHFLELIGADPLPLFSLLVSTGTGHSETSSSKEGASPRPRKKWNSKSKQLHDAINVIIVTWDVVANGPLLDIKKQLEEYPHSEPFDSKIKAVNTIASKDPKGRTIQDMISELGERNSVRRFEFGELNAALDSAGINSHFG